VAVPRAVCDDELLAGAARTKCGIAQPDAGEGAVRARGGDDFDEPAGAAAANREQAALSCRQRARRSRRARRMSPATRSRAYPANGAEIDSTAAGEAHRPATVIELDGVEPNHARAASMASADGTHPRGRNPQQRLSGVDVIEGPSVAVQFAAAVQQRQQRLVSSRPARRSRAAVDVAERLTHGTRSAGLRCDRFR
jgi:hypothetical protein